MLKKIGKRICNAGGSLVLDVKHELQSNKTQTRRSFMAGAVAGGLPAVATMAWAAPGTQTITGMSNSILGVINELYTASFGIVTALVATLLIIAFIVRMTAGQQKATQATSWIVRILVCYAAINCIGLITGVIETTFAGNGYTP